MNLKNEQKRLQLSAMAELVLGHVASGIPLKDSLRRARMTMPQWDRALREVTGLRPRLLAMTPSPEEGVERCGRLLEAIMQGTVPFDAAQDAGFESMEDARLVARRLNMEGDLDAVMEASRLTHWKAHSDGMSHRQAIILLARATPLWARAQVHAGGRGESYVMDAWPPLETVLDSLNVTRDDWDKATRVAVVEYRNLVAARDAAMATWKAEHKEHLGKVVVSSLGSLAGPRERTYSKRVVRTVPFVISDEHGMRIEEREHVTNTDGTIKVDPSLQAITLMVAGKGLNGFTQDAGAVLPSEEDAAAMLNEMAGSDADTFLLAARGEISMNADDWMDGDADWKPEELDGNDVPRV